MARPQEVLVESNPIASEPVDVKTHDASREHSEEKKIEIARYIKLVDIIRRSRIKKVQDAAFNEIAYLMEPKINRMLYKLDIPGYSRGDVYQEALFALRFKAIKDYDPSKSNVPNQKSAFDQFAALCIRRHLSTKLKSSYQNRNRVLNKSVSLDQNRNKNNGNGSMDGELYLSDVVPKDNTDILTEINTREYRNTLFSKLFQKLSIFEKEVFLLYAQGYSYEHITDKINGKKRKEVVNVKSIDNALSRIKSKAKEVYDKYGDEETVITKKSIDNALSRIKSKGKKVAKKLDEDD